MILFPEAAARRCSVKKVFLKISQNSQKTPVLDSLFNKVEGVYLKLEHSCFPLNFAKFL